jgi:thioredoxin reductase (NADPH)
MNAVHIGIEERNVQGADAMSGAHSTADDSAVSAANRPVMVVVADGAGTRNLEAASLRRRYGADYRVLAVPNPEAAFATLTRLREAAVDVALIVAGQRMLDETGTAFMARSRGLYPTARRLLTTAWADLSVMQSVARASTLGEIDHHATRPRNETDEQFLSIVGDILAEWSREHGRFDPALTIVGEQWEAEAQSLGDVLQRWGAPLRFLEAASPAGERLLADHGLDGHFPVLVLPDGRAMVRPSVSEVAEAFGANSEPLSTPFDVAVLGSGPAGLSAAANAGAEGLRVLLIEPSIGQASSSPMIRNYLGFPAGVSGAELVRRAWQQAWMFGVQARMGHAGIEIQSDGRKHVITLDDGSDVHAAAVVLATGVAYRQLGIPSVEDLVGHGVFYGAGATEAQALAGEPVAVVGGGNSAAQAAVHLARYASSVRLVVRGGSLEEGVSDYLRQQLGVLPNVEVRLDTEVIGARGAGHLRKLTLRDNGHDSAVEIDATALFVVIGAAPRTGWLPAQIARDERGYVLTGDDAPAIPLGRPRLPLETTMPGVFAAGDVRHGSIKRVSVAVGEGAAATQQVMSHRAMLAADPTAVLA